MTALVITLGTEMKMLKILLRAMEKQACAHEICWHGLYERVRFSNAHSSSPRVDLLHLITRFIKPTRDARKFRLRRGSRLAVTERDDLARLFTGAPGSQPTL